MLRLLQLCYSFRRIIHSPKYLPERAKAVIDLGAGLFFCPLHLLVLHREIILQRSVRPKHLHRRVLGSQSWNQEREDTRTSGLNI